MNYQIDPEACNQDFTCLSIYVKIARVIIVKYDFIFLLATILEF